ncbi:hypothetical protein A6A04_19455 [Paramagnetospirillum marisnigri]|uniref:Uncharacterized protein n=1 Tax=Paramagnetospirillum marisnigri TaxID=1285242 RepID=A0A178MMW1_9PROT|nr:hypothetical protein [Paramagnetospirillum marisnigri]OAN49405.1 hypothetical protein A6A04_19455 [Paramagnetospirillum marisnigri]
MALESGDTLAIEPCCNFLGGDAAGVHGKDSPHHLGLFFNDLALSGFGCLAVLGRGEGLVSIGQTTGHLALGDTARLPTAGLVSEVLGELLSDQSQHGDVHVGDLTRVQGVYPNPLGGEDVVHASQIGETTAQPIHAFANDNIEPMALGVGQHALILGAEGRASADFRVSIDLNH